MAKHIHGPLYYERMGRTGPVIAFIHPNPMDQSCWIFQMAHLSTWYRCIAIDIPGYGRSPKADTGRRHDRHGRGLLGGDRRRCPARKRFWSAVRSNRRSLPMYHLRPDKTAALVLSGTGYNPNKEFTKGGLRTYRQRYRLSLGLHVRRFERVISHHSAGAFLCEPLHRAQPTCRRGDDHPPV